MTLLEELNEKVVKSLLSNNNIISIDDIELEHIS